MSSKSHELKEHISRLSPASDFHALVEGLIISLHLCQARIRLVRPSLPVTCRHLHALDHEAYCTHDAVSSIMTGFCLELAFSKMLGSNDVCFS